MEAHPIGENSSGRSRFARGVVDLVENVGRADFCGALFRLSHEATGCKHLTAFALGAGQPPNVILAENVGNSRVAFTLAQKYVTQYWQLDPANRVSTNAAIASECWGINSSAKDITDSIYRSHCYSAVGLDHRLSISHRRGNRIYRLNFYSDHGRKFSESATGNVLDAADLLMALVRRQDAETAEAIGMPVDAFPGRLRQLAPLLSERELQVAALIAGGLSSHGIALELGVSINTVRTYRKRAYARLNISTQNELMQLLLGTRTLM
jgi:DNA-binding CsgD family transcriptional regulator